MLFSIIIPTYNRANFIQIAIKSVLAQSYQEFEIIIVDDGSTDNTIEVVNAFADPRIQYYYTENSERSAARNLGIQKCGGEYVCFLDSDDAFKPNHLMSLKDAIQSDPGNKLYQTGWVVQLEGEETEVLPDHPTNAYKYLWFTGVPINAFCFDREVLKLEQFPEEYWVWEDRHLMFRVMEHRDLQIIQVPTAVFVEHGERFMNSANPKVLLERINQMPAAVDDLVNAIGDSLLQHITPYDIKRKKGSVLLVYAQDAILAGEKEVADIALNKAQKLLVLRSFPRWIILKFIVMFWPVFKKLFDNGA